MVAAALTQTLEGAPDPADDPAYAPLTQAFDALRLHRYDAAISFFEKAVSLSPGHPDIRKNLAYTLLKIGEDDAARAQFGEAMRLDPSDLHVALEYAFLCYEARDGEENDAPARRAEARRIFDRIRGTGDPALRATASQAFENIDAPLAAGIARWKAALAAAPPTFSALHELARLAEERDELDLAATSYRQAFQLLPERKSVLLELARVEKARGNSEGAVAALLAASRAAETRTAELAREQLPDRYPYVYEFRGAMALDPGNGNLHRELAFLLLAMSEKGQATREAAEQEFQQIVDQSPDDYVAAAQLGLLYLADHRNALAMPLLNRVLAHADAATAARVRAALGQPPPLAQRQSGNAAGQVDTGPLAMAERSYKAGFLPDARRYFLAAYEQNPGDASIALRLGWTSNLLHDDGAALHWFDIARRSPDPAISTEAGRAYANLRPSVERFRTTLWAYPLFSSRWRDLFGYGQLKTEANWKKLPFHPYVSLRFVGDARRSTGGVSPQSLSESALILGAGVATRYWRGAMAWFEAGRAVSYINGSTTADYRGGISWARTIGAPLMPDSGAAGHSGWFFETLADTVFISRFGNDLLNYSQNRTGFTSALGPFRIQTFWSNNLTFDVKKQYWANFAETGPGFRFHPPGAPPSLAVTLGVVRGIYLRNEGNPRRPNFVDFRAGIWYALTK